MLKETVRRAKSPTPKFFRKLIRIGLTIGAIGLTLQEPHITPYLPPVVNQYSGYAIAIGAVVSVISSLTVDNTKTIDFKPKK